MVDMCPDTVPYRITANQTLDAASYRSATPCRGANNAPFVSVPGMFILVVK